MMKLFCIWMALAGKIFAAGEQAGTTTATFLKLGTGARSIAMGEAYVALSDDAEGLSYNPAGMDSAYSQLQLTHNEWFDGVMSEHLAGIISMGELGTFGANLNYLFIPGQPVTVQVARTSDPAQNFRQIGSFSPFDTYATLSYANSFFRDFSYGASLKISGQSIYEQFAVGLGLDLGLVYRTPLAGLNLATAVQNFGLPVILTREKFSLPLITRFGACYALNKIMVMSAELDTPNDSQMVLAVGFEYNFQDTLYPRLGYRLDGIFNPWSAGLGFRLGKTSIDLAMVPYGELGQTYRISLSYAFGRQLQLSETLKQVPYVFPTAVLDPPKSAMLLTDKETFVDVKTHVSYPEKVKAWTFYIYGKGEKPSIIRKVVGTGVVPEDLTWNALMDTGESAAPGAYPAILVVAYHDGKIIYSNYVRLSLSNNSQLDLK